MNRIYRLVYNRTLGVWQVASELVKAARGGRSSGVGLSMAALHPVSFGLWLALGWVGLAQPVTAQQTPGAQAGRIIADPSAPDRQRPTVVTSANGTPQVNITTPSAGGVSRNTYSQFDVGSEGAILNNSRGNVQTQLGGWVQGNPWLGKGTARVILNEVNSANPSQLHGYVEVAGDRAQVVIANPAGISVDGGGFLNASRVTLTTGTAIVNGGVLDGYRVDGGAVRISGAGLDASEADYTDIISRSLEVNANIWAKQLQASLGSNVVSADQSQVSAQAAGGNAPMFALDVGALGGMYANKIWLVGNEHGVGMRNAGKIGAQAGELVVQADGRLENLGTLQSQLDTKLSVTGGLANSGTVSAGNEVNLTTQTDLDNSGGTLNARRIEIEAASLRNAGGAIEQTGLQALVLQAGSVINRNDGRIGLQSSSSEPGEGGGTQPGSGSGSTGGTGGGSTGENGGGTGTGGTGGTPLPTLAAGALRIAGALDNSGGRINAGGQMRLSAESGLDNAGGQLGLQRFVLNGGDLDNSDGHIVVSDQASIRAGSVSNDRGRLEIANQFDFQAERLSNRDGKLTHTGAASTVLSVAGELDNEGGALLSKADSFTIDAAQLINRDGRIEHAGSQALKVTVDQLQGQKGVIATAAELELRGGAVDNRDAAISAEHALLQVESLDNRGGSVVANGIGSSIIEVAGSLDNSDEGLLASDGDLSVSAKTLANEKGRIQHAGDGVLTIAAETLNGKGGNILGNGTLTLSGENTNLSEGTTAAKKISIDTGNLSTTGGKLIASGDGLLDIAARQALNNAGGVLATNGVLSLSAAQLNNQNGTIQAAGAGNSNLQITGALDNSSGSVVAAGNTTINAASVLNSGGTVQAAGASTLQITADGLLDNSEEGLLASGGDLSVSAETLDNQAGRIEHAGEGALTITAETLNGKGGSIIGNGALTLTGEHTDLSDGTITAKKISIDTGNLSTAGGKLVASGDEVLDITARQALNNAGGTVATNGALSLTAAQLNNRAGEIQAAGAGNSKLQVSGTLDNSGGAVAAAGNTTITAAELLNVDGTVQAVGTSTLQVTVDGLLDNGNEGLLASGGDLTVSAQTLDNENGRIEHAGDGALTVAANTLNGKGGSIIGNGALTLTGEHTDLSEGTTAARKISIDTGSLSSAGGKLIASGDELLDISVRQALNNAGGTVATNGALSLGAAQLNNQNGTIQAAGAGNSTLQVGGTLDNSGGTVAAAGNTTITAADLINVGGTVQAAGTSVLQLTVDGLLDNSSEGLLASGSDLIISALTLDNEKGRIEHAGDGELAIATETLSGKSGNIIGNGTLTLSGENIDLSDGTTTAKMISVDTGNLSTAGGTLIASGGDVLELGVRQTLNNAGGTIATNGALALAAAQLNNQDGTIQAAGRGATHVDVTNTLNNSGGTVAAAGNTTITAANLLNVGGTVQAAGTSTLQVSVDGLLDNSDEGLLTSGDDLSISAGTLDNQSGRIEHAGDGVLTIAAETLNGNRGSIIGNGALALIGENTDLSEGTTAARKISIDTGNLSTAGGKLIASGDEVLDISVRQTLNNAGGTVATNGALSLGAAQLNNQNGTIQAAGAGKSTLQVGGTLVNNGGTVAAAGNTTITAADLLNVGGILQAAGTSTLQVTVDGLLDNSDEGLLTSGGDLTVDAQTLANKEGRIEHAGDGALTIAAETLNGKGGSIVGNGSLALTGENTDLSEGTTAARKISIDSGSLSTAGGKLIASGDEVLDITVRRALNNAGGTVATNGALSLKAADLDNQDGTIQAAGTAATHVAVANTLDNSGGTIAAAGNTTITSAELINIGGTVHAAGTSTLEVSVDGLLDNGDEGLLASGGDLSVSAQTLDNEKGRIEHAGDGTLLIAAENFNGKGGSIIGNGALSLSGENTDLSEGTTAARKISIDTGNLSTAGGKLIASGDEVLDVSVRQTLNNAGGTVATNGALSLVAAQLNNLGGMIQAAGIGNSTLQVAGTLENSGGTVAAAGNTTITAANLLNVGGTVQAAGTSTLQVSVDGLLDNSDEGLLASGGDLTVSAQTLVNEEGRIEHAGDGALAIAAETLNGKGGSIIGNGMLTLTGEDTDLSGGITAANKISIATGTLSNAGGKLVASSDEVMYVSVRQTLNNAGGTLATNGVLSLAAAKLNNQSGTIQAAGNGATRIDVAAALDNSGGTVAAAGNATINAAELINIGGTVQAAGISTLQVTVDGLLDNSAEGLLASGGDLTVSAKTLANEKGRIEHAGGGALTIAAETLNGKGGSIIGNGTLTLTGEDTDLSDGTTAAKKISIETGNLSTAGGKLIASGDEVLDITVRHNMNNAGGTVASNGALSLGAAQLDNREGAIQAAGLDGTKLQISGSLDNSGGTVAAAGNTTITAAELLNVGGTVQAAGTSTLQVTVDGLLDNSEDGLLASAGDLTVSAQTLKNQKGRIEHAGDGVLAIAAETLSGKGGSIVGNGTLTLTGENTDLSDGTTAGRTISIDTGNLSTAGGKLIASGDEVLDISVRQTLNNAGGTVATNGALSLSAAQLNNQSGTIQAAGAGNSTLQVVGTLDNSGGIVAAAGNTVITAAELRNVNGTVQAAGTSTLQVTVDGLLNNSDQGLLASGGDLTISAKTLDNQTGRIEHAGDGALTIAADTLNGKGGSIIGNGALTLTGENTDLSDGTTAGKQISIDTGNLSTAGGKLIASGDEVLDISVRQTLNNAGGTVATNGALSLGAAQLNNQNGTIQAAGAGSSKLQVGRTLDNSGGTIAAAGNTTINAAELINAGGTVQAAGTSTLQVTVDGLLDNSEEGLLASGGDLSVSAKTLDNQTGRIEHAGDGALTIAAATLNGKGGSIIGNGTLTLTGEDTDLSDGTTAAKKINIETGSLSAAGGKLIASGNEVLDITVRQSMNNAGGTVATNGALSLSAGQLHNQRGAIQVAGTGDSTLRVAGTLDNSGGALTTAGATSINAGSLLNNGGSIAASSSQTLELEVRQELSNDAGSIVGNGDIQLRAENLSNRGGAIETQRSIDAVVSNTLDNSSGTLLAGQALSLQGNALLNQKLAGAANGGILAGSNVVLRMDAVDNSLGRISATQGLDVVARHLQNTGGVIDASGDLDITVAGLDNSAGKLIQRNEDGELTLQVDGLLANAGGLIGAEGDASLSAASVDNVAGTVSTQRNLAITSTGAINNQSGGLLQSGGATLLNAAGSLNNAGGHIDAAKAATVTAAGIDNSGGSILAGTKSDQDSALLINAGSLLDNSSGTIANRGSDVTISAGTINNTGGTLVAQRDIALHTSSVLNNAGTLYSTRDLRYEGAQAQLDNGNGRFGAGGTAYLTLASANNAAGGRIQAGTLWLAVPGFVNNGEVGADVLHVNLTGAIAGAGSMFATQWLDARYDGDFTYTSQQLKSDGRLDLTVSGNFTNKGTLHSAGELTVTAKDVTNLGSIVASNQAGTGVARIDASGTLDNRDGASIEADNLHLSANDVINTGDISGDTVLIEANTLVNGRDLGQAMAVRDYGEGFIGAVDHLELRVARQLSNLDGEIFSGGNLVIAGRADDTRVERLDNISGRIQAEQGLWLDATNVINQRRVLQTEHRVYVGQEQFDDPDGGSTSTDSVPEELRKRYCPENSRTRCVHFEGYTSHENRVLEGTRVVLASAASQLLSGGTMQLDVGRLDNIYSNIAAGGDLSINGRQITDSSDPSQWTGVINNVALAGYKMIQQESIAEIEYQTCGTNFDCLFEPRHATVSLSSNTFRKDYVLADGAATITAGGGLTIIGGAINNTVVQSSGGIGGVTTAPVSNIGNADLGSSSGHQAGGAAAVGSAASSTVSGGQGVQSSTGDRAQAGGGILTSQGNSVQAGAGVGAADANSAGNAGSVQTVTRNNVTAGTDVQAANGGGANARDRIDGVTGGGVQSRDGVQATAGAGATAGTGVQVAVGGHVASVSGPDAGQGVKAVAGGNAAGVGAGTVAAGAGPEGAAPQFVGTTERPLPGLVPADNGMFKRSADPNSPFLVSTAPRFEPTDTAGSEYLLGKLGSPDDVHKRLGDAYYEQRLVQDQLLALTGRQRLQGEDGLGQYRMLMDNAAQVADALGLNLGSALTGAQIGALDHDIVWLVEQEIDGQKVLVPVVYLSKATAERLRQGGALMAGDSVEVRSSGPLNNDGTLAASKSMWLGADTLINNGAISVGDRLAVTTAGDTLNRGAISAGSVSIDAGRDFVQSSSGSLSATGNIVVDAARNIDVTASTTQETVVSNRGRTVSTFETLQSSSLQAGGNLVLQAGQDVNLEAADLKAGESMTLAAGRDLNLSTVTTTDTSLTQVTSKRYSMRSESLDETVHGTTLAAGGDIALVAGRDVTLTAAQVASDEGGIGISAGRDVKLTAAQEQHDLTIDEQRKKKGFLKSKTTTTHDEWHDSIAVTSTLSGETVTVAAGRDLTSQGAQIAGTGDVILAAGRDLTLGTAQSTSSETHDKTVTKSGLFGSGGIGFTVGKQRTDTEADITGVSHTGSTVGSLGGDVTLVAGNALKIEGSDVIALQGDITGKAKSISITEVHDTSTAEQQTRFKQAGLTVAVSAPALSLLETANDLSKAAKQSGGDGRMQALAAGTAALNAYNSAGAMGQLADGLASGNPADMAKGANVSISATIGASKSSSQSTQSSSQAKGSSLQAGGDVSLIATGGGEESNILIRGSDITAGKDVLLAADNSVTLEAAQSTAEQHSSSKSSSGAIGVAASYGSDGAAFGITASASVSRGNADGKDVTQRNTHVTAGNTATVISGGNTTLKGAQLSADKVVANVGGDLNIESLQDTSTYDSKNKSMGASVTVGAGFSGSASYSSSKVDGDYASVTEQSGIQAGAGGFDITVAGNTDLKGAVIASSQEAIDAGLNRLQTGTLTSSDIENHSQYNAKSVSLSGGYSVAGEGGATEGSPSTTNNGSSWSWQNFNTGAQGASAGYGSEKGKENSTTISGISGGTVVITDQSGQQALTGKSAEEALAALNRDVLTGDDANGLAKAWDGQKLQQQVEAQAQITAMFGQQASKAVGDYAQKQMELAAEKRQEAAKATDPAEKDALNALADQLSSQWGESGSLRVLAHTVIGGLTGGVGGAAGAAAGTLTAPKVADALREAGVTGPLADVLTGVASTAVGAAAGGTAGGAAGLNEVANNYLSHSERMEYLKEVQACDASKGGDNAACSNAAGFEHLSSVRNDALRQACVDSASAACSVEIDKAMVALDSQFKGEGEYWSWLANNPLELHGSVDNERALVTHSTLADLVWKIDCARANADCGTTGSTLLSLRGDPVTAARHESLRAIVEGAGKVGGVGGRAVDSVAGLVGMLKDSMPIVQLGKSWDAIEYVKEFGFDAYLNAERAKAGAVWTGVVGGLEGYVKDAGSALGGQLTGGNYWDLYDLYRQGNISGKIGFDAITSVLGGPEIVGIGKVVLAERRMAAAFRAARAEAAESTRVANAFYKDGAPLLFPQELKTSNGLIRANPDKTTTILGSYGSDMGSVINAQLGRPKSMVYDGANQPGSFNVLNTPDALYTSLGPDLFWEKVNRPFLDSAIARGDDIVLASPPNYSVGGNVFNDKGQLTGYGRELKYLEEKGYVYDSGANRMVK